MEDILAKLLVADNETIKKGTAELREAFKKPEHVNSLLQIAMSSKNPDIRQCAIVLLKKRYKVSTNWFQLPQNVRDQFKSSIIQCLMNEPDKHVQKSVALMVGVISKHELPTNLWPEILQFIEQSTLSNDVQHNLLGMFTLSAMTDEAPKVFMKHIQAIITLLGHIFANKQNVSAEIHSYAIKVMINLAGNIDSNQELLNAYNKMLPDVLIVIRLMGPTEPEKAIASLEILNELCEQNTSIIVNHMKIIVGTCLEMANNVTLKEELRAKAISIISWLTKVKKKVIIKHKLVEPIIDSTFQMLSIKPQDDNDESYFGEDDEAEPVACASETLDALACNLPPEMIIPPLLCYVEPALTSNDRYKKKAAYLSMAIVAEGCSDYVRTKHLKTCLSCICQGISDPQPVVRNAALFALGRFAEYLQPDISTFSSELLPILFDQLQRIYNESKTNQPASSNHMFYALEEFCENLELELLPFLPTLIDRLFNILMDQNVSLQLREHALSTLGAAANAAKENIAPYFKQIIQLLNPYLISETSQDPDQMALKIQAVETLGILARTVGKEEFAPICTEVLEFALKILKETTDPDLKKVTYALCASLSTIMKGDISPALPAIVGCMLTSIQSTEGIVAHSKDDYISGYPITEYSDEEDEDIENTDNEDESDDDSQMRFTVENAYTAEKEEAIIALKDIAEYTGEHFNSYLKNCFDKIMELINDPVEDIRESVIMTLTQFVINFWNVKTEEGVQATQESVRILMSHFATIIRLDENKKVVTTAVTSLTHLLKTIKESLLVGAGHKENIMACIKQIFTGDTACQDNEDDTENNESAESEQEEVLIECAGDLLSSFGKVASKEDFTPCFEANLPTLLNYFNKNENEGLQSFAVGIIAECFQGLKENVRQFQQLYQFLMKCCKHSNEEVRNNAYYGIGEMVFHGKDVMYPFYMEILTAFSNAITHETHPGARDNIMGAIARMILTNHSILPLDKIYPTFVQQLPLKQDFVEYKSIYESVLLLYSQGHEALKIQLKPLLKIAIAALNEPKFEEQECKAAIFEFLQRVHRDFVDVWNETLTEVPVEYHAVLAQVFA